MKSFIMALCALIAAGGLRADTITVTNDSLPAGQTVNWTANNVYILKGFVCVKAGSRLNIAPGTVVKAEDGKASDASALIVSRGGKLHAKGRLDKPIIFTAKADDPSKPGIVGYDPATTKGLWGGVIICGRAPNNVNGQVMQAEGVPPELGDLIKYGDSTNVLDQTTGKPTDSAAHARNTHDTSGVLQYVSIRYAGMVLAANKEINGLTLCSVGKGTVISHIEVFNGADDGFEWFGGTVDCKYLVSAFADDDAFDYDQGYSGKCQFLFALQNAENGRANRLGEFDSDDGADISSNAGSKPYSKPVWYNCTFFGSGKGSGNAKNDFALVYKEDAGGAMVNSIIGDFAGIGIQIEDKAGVDVDARGRFLAGDIALKNNIFFSMGKGTGDGQISDSAWIRDSLLAHANKTSDPKIRCISRVDSAKLDPRPDTGSPALVSANVAKIPSGDKFFVQTSYLGAFDPNDLWVRGWTLLSQGNFLIPRDAKQVDVYADSLKAGQSYKWTSDKEYILNGFVFVPPGARLTIDPGTVIRGREGSGSSASALIVSRGGRLYAKGTATAPIIFTAFADDIDKPSTIGFDPSTTKGLWGGVIICGRAPNNINGQVLQAEGVPAEYGDLIKYGDSANALDQTSGNPVDAPAREKNIHDTSGVLEYISIRFAGSALAPNKEINGLTLCSVGKGTVISHIEVFNGADDGFEWFGGTVDCKHLVSAFADDDAFDYDQGYSGKCQFLFALQNAEKNMSNRLGEFDSDDGADVSSNAGAKPYSKPVWYNCTFIGSGKGGENTKNDYALVYKENAGGSIVNSIFGDVVGAGISIEDKTGDVDARGRLAAGDLVLKNNIFFNMGKVKDSSQISDTAWIRDSLLAHKNGYADPGLGGISRTNDGKLIPQPKFGGAAWSNLAAVPSGDAFFTTVSFRGAFGGENWAKGWSFLDKAGFFGDFSGTKHSKPGMNGIAFGIEPVVRGNRIAVRYSLPEAGQAKISLYGLDGARVADVCNGYRKAGVHTVNLDASTLAKATYLLRMSVGSRSVVQKLIVVR